jgi:3(or 17)beta-hydroxysteroid dehydrogenase
VTNETARGRLAGKVALVTGAGAGLGRATALRLAEEGARVVLTDVDQESVHEAAREIGRGALALGHDVTSEKRWQEVVAQLRDWHGRLDVLVNNAGIEIGDRPQDPEHQSLEDFRRIERVNLEGVFLGCRHSIPLLRESGGGSILNVSSIAAFVGTPLFAAYGATKAGVMQLTKSVAAYCARGGMRIRCNSVHPGMIVTAMMRSLWARLERELGVPQAETEKLFIGKVPLGEFQQPVDIANAVLFLATDEARFITGVHLPVDGGFTIHD